MWQKQNKGGCGKRNKRLVYVLIGFSMIGLLLVGCGGASSASTTTAAPASGNTSTGYAQNSGARAPASTQDGTSSTGQGKSASQVGPQYLVKTLQVSMEVQDTLQSASDLQQWVSLSDPQATSDGSDYQQSGASQYTVTLTFLVDSSHYAQVEDYLRQYAGQKGNTLLNLHETVQDVTNDYVDAQSTLTNLRAEQQRLLNFMNQAQNLNDAVNIEQQLTQVEGQIDQIEAHLNALKGQTTFYTVTITLQPIGSAPPPPAKPSPWSAFPIWQGAWSAVISVWQLLVTLLIWLLAFSVYIVPVGIVAWVVRKRLWQRLPRVLPTAPVGPPADAEPK
jgi:uncharacterized protein DUF4349